MQSSEFERFGGLAALLAGLAGFLYAVAFILLQNPLLYSLFLLLIGLFSSAALTAVYFRVRATDEPFALWALILSLAGAFGSAIHGGYDLANEINAPGALPASLTNLPSQVDPRGLLTFGVAGLALFTVSWLIGRGTLLPKGLSYLGYLSAILLIILYLGRLIVLSPTNPLILIPALLNGFLVSPAWYVWLGLSLTRARSA
jgi:hypothetical protein